MLTLWMVVGLLLALSTITYAWIRNRRRDGTMARSIENKDDVLARRIQRFQRSERPPSSEEGKEKERVLAQGAEEPGVRINEESTAEETSGASATSSEWARFGEMGSIVCA